MSPERVLVMDYAWPDLSLEQQILSEAGYELVSVVDEGRPAIELVNGCVAIMTCWAVVPAELLQAGRELRMVARFGVGTDNIDVKEARRLGLEVTYVPDYCMEEVSDHALGLALAWYRGSDPIRPLRNDVAREARLLPVIDPAGRLSGVRIDRTTGPVQVARPHLTRGEFRRLLDAVPSGWSWKKPSPM